MSVLFPASVVGSLPRPQYLRDLIDGRSPLDPATRALAIDRAIASAIALQEQAGLDVVTDGEWRRLSYIGVIADLAHGFTRETNPADGRPWTVVTDRLSPATTGFIAREAKFARGLTRRQVKITLPAPALLGERMWDPVRSAKAYPKREDFVRDCVPILRRELEAIREAGADIVQIDDPHLCLFVDPEVRAQYPDAEAAAAFAVDMVNSVADGFEDLNLAVHLCRRAGARARGEECRHGSFEAILPHINRLKVKHLTMEFTSPGAGDVAVLKGLRPDFEIGLGCVGVTPGKIDSPETIVDRVEQALRHVDKRRITLNPDCGFAPGSAAKVDLDEVYQKLRNQSEAAARLRARHG